ncbi:MAG: hypothetical protein ABR507_12175 [Actinomycetota bacterium]
MLKRLGVLLLVLAFSMLVSVFPASAGGSRGSEKGHGDHGKSKASSQDHPSDPAGNNGFFKVDGNDFDGGPNNDPHVGCNWDLIFYNYDLNQHANITYTAINPTGGAVKTALTQNDVLISRDAARGGSHDLDETLHYSLSLMNLAGVTPAKQGYHFKVAADAIGAPGGAKSKVFWVQCFWSATSGTTKVRGISHSTATSVLGEEHTPLGEELRPLGQVSGTSFRQGALSSLPLGTSVLGTTFVRERAATTVIASKPATSVLGVSFTRGRVLPFTGLDSVPLAVAAIALSLFGSLLVAVGGNKGKRLR